MPGKKRGRRGCDGAGGVPRKLRGMSPRIKSKKFLKKKTARGYLQFKEKGDCCTNTFSRGGSRSNEEQTA